MNLIACVDCGEERLHKARGCCVPCYSRRFHAGDVTQKAPPPRPGGVIVTVPVVDGLTYRQLDYWTTRGYLVADEKNPGTGRRRTWPDGELQVAATMLRLSNAGLTVEAAHRVARGEQELAPGVRVLVEAGAS